MGDVYANLTFDNYTIYANDGYYLCVSNIDTNNYQMFIGFSDKDLTTLSKEGVVKEIRKVNDLINVNVKNGIYILPIISPSIIEEAALENDNMGYNNLLNNKIQPITMDVYKKITSRGKKVSDKISMIKQTDMDKKFIGWLSMKLGSDYITELDFHKLVGDKKVEVQSVSNPGIAPIKHQNEQEIVTKNNKNVKRLVRSKEISPGFGSIKFIIAILGFSLLVGITFGNLLIK